MPGGVAGLNRKSPSGNVTREIEQTVDMDEARAVLIEPQHSRAIRVRAFDRRSEVVQKTRPTWVSAREGPRVL